MLIILIIFFNIVHLILPLPIINGTDVGQINNYGKVVNPSTYPYLVLLEIHLTNNGITEIGYCGGTIIEKNVILTAAHCIPCGDRIEIIAWAGIVHIELEKSSAQRIKATNYYLHKDFDFNVNSPKYLHNDIALIWLEKSFELNENVRIAKLPKKKMKFIRKTGVIPGWGYTDPIGNEISSMLKQVNLFVLSEKACECFYQSTQFDDKQFCAMSENRQSGVASGDSGGPFIYDGYIVGILSIAGLTKQNVNGEDLIIPDPRVPAIFLNLVTYYNWIDKTLNSDVFNDQGCSKISGSSMKPSTSSAINDSDLKLNKNKSKSCTIL